MSSINTSLPNVAAAEKAAMQSNISIALIAKQLDSARIQGDAVVQLLDGAANLSKAIGKGIHFDALG